MKKLVVLTGPTAVGKTELSIRLAKAINGEIISADSVQIYKKLDIGSAKITTEEMDNVKHYLVDELEPDEEFNVYRFKEMALSAIEKIYAKGKIPIIVGGTGFYIQSVLYDIDFENESSDSIYREKLENEAKEFGNEYLHNKLKKVDESSAKQIHPNNVKRVIRALEFYYENGYPISVHNKEQRENVSPYNFSYIVLNDDRKLLYDRINKRVDIMVDKGLFSEVKGLLDEGYSRELTSMQGIGYKEVCAYYSGELSKEEATQLIKKNTRHFAKRQLTWFRREKSTDFINYDKLDHDKERIFEAVINLLKNKSII